MSMISRIARFASSPQGRRAVQKATAYARSPEAKRKLEQARQQLASRKRPGAGPR
jgi:hypothetical protein